MNSTNASLLPPPIDLRPKEPLVSFMSDKMLALALPVLAYWSLSMLFHLLDTYNCFEKYRIHTPAEVESRNKCSVGEVIRAVLMQHGIQTAAGIVVASLEETNVTGHEAYEIWKIGKNLGVSEPVARFLFEWLFPSFRIGVAFFLLDTWQYFLHRLMHNNKFLYRTMHSVHHRLYVPYAFGALYNSLAEGFLLDTAGTGLASQLMGLSDRENMILFVFSTVKTVDDHCGYEFPWDPLQILFPNRATYHDIHHQHFGIKTNFAQPFFIHWDVLLGSKYPETESYIAKNKQIRLEKYEANKRKLKESQKAKKE